MRRAVIGVLLLVVGCGAGAHSYRELRRVGCGIVRPACAICDATEPATSGGVSP